MGTEVQKLDQLFRVEAGTGEGILDRIRTAVRASFALYTVDAPPNHRDRVGRLARFQAGRPTGLVTIQPFG